MFLYTCQPCLNGDHENCERNSIPGKGIFGGKRCICGCLGRSKEQIKRDWEDHMAKIMESTNQHITSTTRH
jgi:hypothetical protein